MKKFIVGVIAIGVFLGNGTFASAMEFEEVPISSTVEDLSEKEMGIFTSLKYKDKLPLLVQIKLTKVISNDLEEFTQITEEEMQASEYLVPGNSATVANIYTNNLVTAKKIYNKYLGLMGYPTAAESYRSSMFYSLVQNGGDWDIKLILGNNNRYKLMGTSRTGEYIGNHHYGFMGRHIGYGEFSLKFAAGAYQIYSDQQIKYLTPYFDQPEDTEAIGDGFRQYLYKFYRTGTSPEPQ